MRITVAGLGARCHQLGWLLHDVDLDLGPGLTLLTGRVGSGTSLLLHLLGGIDSPQLTGVRGRIHIDGKRLGTRSSAELGAHVEYLSPTWAKAGTLRGALATHPELATDIDRLDLGDHLDTACTALPAHVAGRAAVAVALAGPARVLLVDQILADLAATWWEPIARRLREAADEGRTIVWAEHRLDAALPVADHVVELVGHEASCHPAETWVPTTRPPTVLRRLASNAGLPPSSCDDPEQVPHLFATHGITALSRGTARRSQENAHVQLNPEAVGLSGPLVDAAPGEVLGVLGTDPRHASAAARALARDAGGRRLDDRHLAAMLRMGPIRKACTSVAGRGDANPLEDIQRLLGPVGTRDAHAHSDGQRRLMAACLALAVPGPTLLVEPTRGVDVASTMTLTHMLHRPSSHPTIVASRDIEFLVRVADRILLVEDTTIVADATPKALLDRMPHAPLISRAVPGLRAVRNRDLNLVRADRPGGPRR